MRGRYGRMAPPGAYDTTTRANAPALPRSTSKHQRAAASWSVSVSHMTEIHALQCSEALDSHILGSFF